jgi:ribosome-associated translation inhibitor RaiA
MRVRLRTVHVTIRPETRQALQERIEAAFARHEGRIVTAEVWVVDLNGPRGGPDKCCRVRVKLRPRGRLYLQETDTNVSLAVDRALDRLQIALTRTLERRRELRRARSASHRLIAELPI